MFKLAGLLLAATLVATLSPGTMAQDLRVTEVRAPVLMLWTDTEGSSLVAEIPKGDVPPDLPVKRVSANLMLEVTVNGQTGWVFGHHVKTNAPVKISAECDPNVSNEEVGAVRGLGEGCE